MPEKAQRLADQEELNRLTQRSNLKGLVQLAGHLCLVGLTALSVALSMHSALLAPALLLYGISLTFFFAPLHESIHFTAFNYRWINNAVAAICGFILLIPYRYFRAYHYAHHRHTQNSDRDPELIDKKAWSKLSYALYLSGLPFWWNNVKVIYLHALGDVNEPYLEQRGHNKIIAEARLHLGLYLLLAFFSLVLQSSLLWWYWLLPLLLGQPFLRLFLLAEHSNCDFSNNMLENSRTTYTSPLVNFLAWNMPFHAEHHYLASVPFHALPALHAYTGRELKYKGDGYLAVNREIARRIGD